VGPDGPGRCWCFPSVVSVAVPPFLESGPEAPLSDTAPLTTELDELVWSTDGRRVSFVLDESLYPRDAIYGAAYLFIGRCFLFFTRPGEGQVEVRIKPKDAGSSPAALEALAGEFGNELFNQVIRQRVGEATSQIREYYMAKAFFADSNQTSIDALLAELDAEELEEDPLEIAVPWEESHG